MTECERIVKSETVPESFLLPETRNDYEITARQKKVWLIELDLLREFDSLCKAHGIRYFAGFGTLLGAVRHHGFIPWDDDLDVWVPREDYERMLKINSKTVPHPYFLQTTLNDRDYYSAFARLRNSNTTGILVSQHNKCNNGIYMDIYPLDGIHKNPLTQYVREARIKIMNVVAHAYVFNINPSRVTHAIHDILHLPFIAYNPQKTYRTVNALAASQPWNDGERVGTVVFAPYKHNQNIYCKEDFSSAEVVPFEFLNIPIPKGYQRILTTIYGDYMRFPPVEIRGTWHNFTFEPDIPYMEYCKDFHNTPPRCEVKTLYVSVCVVSLMYALSYESLDWRLA